MLLLAVVGGGIAHVSSQQPTALKNNPQFAIGTTPTDKAQPLDEVASTDVAVHVARLVRLEEATAVVNKADTAHAELSVAAADDQVLSKPQIVDTNTKSVKDIQKYTPAAEESIDAIAQKFGITPDTIRLSNGLNGDTIPAGKEITISPVDGITYVIKDGDTPDSLAAKYSVPIADLISFNDAELSGTFKTGDTIVIPDAVQPAVVRTASYTNASTAGGFAGSGGFSFGSNATYGGNGYDFGWCTWHAANRRIQIGKPLPTNLGNASSWLSLAQRAGLSTGNVPKAGAVLYHKNIGGLGHVAYVEKVNEDGTALVSDMNYPTWGSVTYRTITPSEYGNYAFIY